VQAHMALPKHGKSPQARPFHLGLPVTSAYCHSKEIAVAHSICKVSERFA